MTSFNSYTKHWFQETAISRSIFLCFAYEELGRCLKHLSSSCHSRHLYGEEIFRVIPQHARIDNGRWAEQIIGQNDV